MDKLCDRTQKLLTFLAGALFTGVFVITVLNIVLRNMAGIAWLWIPGASRLLFIWTVFLGAAVLYYHNDHLLMDFFVAKISTKNKRRLDLVIHGLFLVFLVLLMIYGTEIARVRMRISFETWKFPTGIAYFAAPVSAAFMALFGLNKLRHLWKGDQNY
jgi:TRAP-type C4-dicarboxylate transport system permease small subunit